VIFSLRIALVFPFSFFLTFFSLFSCVLLCGDVCWVGGRCVCVCEIAFSRVVGEFMQVYEIQLFIFVRMIVPRTRSVNTYFGS
jgi:hypothetical protein